MPVPPPTTAVSGTRPGAVRVAAVAGHFGRDVERSLAKIQGIITDAAAKHIQLLVLPDATLGGYLPDLDDPGVDLPPALAADAPEIRRVIDMAADMVVCIGYTELAPSPSGPLRYNAAVCVSGDGVLGRHRKVHQPAGESLAYAAGDRFQAFDTPVGRMGMLIDYDKTFPESTRTLALQGAQLVACLSAWPASVTDRADRLVNDRQARLFDLYDCARAAENQVVVVSSNQTGVYGGLRFLGQAKVVGPGGDILARTWTKGALAVCDIDVAGEVARARRTLHHLVERRVDTYLDHPVAGPAAVPEAAAVAP